MQLCVLPKKKLFLVFSQAETESPQPKILYMYMYFYTFHKAAQSQYCISGYYTRRIKLLEEVE